MFQEPDAVMFTVSPAARTMPLLNPYTLAGTVTAVVANVAGVTADRNLSEKVGVRLGLGRSFGEQKDFNIQGGTFFRLPFADLALTGDYLTAKQEWRVGLRLAFGLAFDPGASRYRMTRPGPAGGGSAVEKIRPQAQKVKGKWQTRKRRAW